MTSSDDSIAMLVTDYLALRRGLGFQLRVTGYLLHNFARYADAVGHQGPITTELANRWAAASQAGPSHIAQRLSVVRQFARHRAAFDPATEIPPAALSGSPVRRKPPHIYSAAELDDLLRAATKLRPRGGLRPQTYATLFSLLACTGLRVSEARQLTHQDVDLGDNLLVIRESKFRKSRLVPLHSTAVEMLKRYATIRDGYTLAQCSKYFFCTDQAATLKKRAVEATFNRLRTRLGWTKKGRARRPRIHDLRHTFAVRRLLCWAEAGADVEQKILALATYLGHANVADTYWYLDATPELLAVTASRFEQFARRAAGEEGQ